MRVCAIVQLGGSVTLDRLGEDVPRLREIAKSASGGHMEQLFRSANGDLFAWLLDVPEDRVGSLRERFVSSTAFRNEDSILVVEIGAWFTGQGFSRAWTWLQHHHG